MAHPGLAEVDKLQPETCVRCGITKYRSHPRGDMRLARGSLLTGIDVQLSNEWFGSRTRTAYREILTAQAVAGLILEQGWRGVALKPVRLI